MLKVLGKGGPRFREELKRLKDVSFDTDPNWNAQEVRNFWTSCTKGLLLEKGRILAAGRLTNEANEPPWCRGGGGGGEAAVEEAAQKREELLEHRASLQDRMIPLEDDP